MSSGVEQVLGGEYEHNQKGYREVHRILTHEYPQLDVSYLITLLRANRDDTLAITALCHSCYGDSYLLSLDRAEAMGMDNQLLGNTYK